MIVLGFKANRSRNLFREGRRSIIASFMPPYWPTEYIIEHATHLIKDSINMNNRKTPETTELHK